MTARLGFGLVAAFWLLMNLLLWREEYGARRHGGSQVSVPAVWERILTAPDDSALEITRQGKRIGYCHWSATASENAQPAPPSGPPPPEGMIPQPAGYVITADGNLLVEEAGQHVTFSLQLRLSADRTWQELTLRLGLRPTTVELHARTADRTVRLSGGDRDSPWSRTFTFDQLRDPRSWLEGFDAATLLPLVAAWPATGPSPAFDAGLRWEAWTDWLTLGHSEVRAYRLEARLADRYPVVLVVSRVGEIMHAELPGGIRVENQLRLNL
jgi:hypothetical protein